MSTTGTSFLHISWVGKDQWFLILGLALAAIVLALSSYFASNESGTKKDVAIAFLSISGLGLLICSMFMVDFFLWKQSLRSIPAAKPQPPESSFRPSSLEDPFESYHGLNQEPVTMMTMMRQPSTMRQPSNMQNTDLLNTSDIDYSIPDYSLAESSNTMQTELGSLS